MKDHFRFAEGFTLVELLVVIAVIAILALEIYVNDNRRVFPHGFNLY